MSGVINVERLTSANFQTHNVVVVDTALSTLCIAVFSLLLLLLLQNSLCLRDFRVFVNFYVCVCVRTICMCARAAVLYVCVGSQLRGALS